MAKKFSELSESEILALAIALQVVVGGGLVFLAGLLIGSA
jgi:hypothetical protein